MECFGDGVLPKLRFDEVIEARYNQVSVFREGGVESGGGGGGSKRLSFGPQCERETGRASQADDTPYGVGGL